MIKFRPLEELSKQFSTIQTRPHAEQEMTGTRHSFLSNKLKDFSTKEKRTFFGQSSCGKRVNAS